jgi:hypothetical protein
LLHFEFELHDHFAGTLITDGAMFAGLGEHLGAIGGDG